jgi:MFS-type transporter involved in bile tolerance (Atg22 family)
MAITNFLVLVSAPVLGAIADHGAHKKRFLAFTTIGCILFTILLGFVGRGDVALGMALVILATLMFASGENFIAAFLPEIAARRKWGASRVTAGRSAISAGCWCWACAWFTSSRRNRAAMSPSNTCR